MLVHPFRVMDVSTSMATGAPDFIPGTSANVREVAGYSGFMQLQQIFYSGFHAASPNSSQRTAAVRILPKEFGSSTPPAIPLVLQLPCFR